MHKCVGKYINLAEGKTLAVCLTGLSVITNPTYQTLAISHTINTLHIQTMYNVL